MHSVARALPHDSLLHRCGAWSVVAGLHLLLGWWLMGSLRPAPGTREESRISLRWLMSEAAPPVAAPPSLPPASQAPARRPSSPPAARPVQGDTGAVDGPPPAAAAGTTLDLALPAGSIDGGDGISAEGVATKVLGRREVHPAFQPRRPPFRLRPQMSPQQKLQAISRFLGLWPPGYMTDPCELARQDMGYLQNAVDPRDRDALREAVLEVSARCR
ncbi:hypothetical protein [Stenotrophomonas sp. 24(2023)]|uniref:hypothetical protein n=1 Tax=Stenotrophomonas sp. 24(2023) TaxID=3068324 RepID=UPI0027DEC787|nr:hypothetical protein [Stenotrophomonas sp. 24(2023)]WMJ68558.1 hypothetical protein Q9R17_15355 [Stenotrophomonas sp. 24(2023)]